MEKENINLLKSLLMPLLFVLMIWIVKITEVYWVADLHIFGIYPQKLSGLRGIFLSPFIHGDFSHLINNSMPLLVLGTALFYFYKDVAFRVIVFSILITGFWVWVIARPSYHIGASGIIYSLAGFLFTSGIIRKHPRLMAISMLVVFIYGGMVWGVFPVEERVSWESHLMGLACGVLLAYFFRAHGPQRKKYSWELEEENELEDDALTEEKDTEYDKKDGDVAEQVADAAKEDGELAKEDGNLTKESAGNAKEGDHSLNSDASNTSGLNATISYSYRKPGQNQ